MFSSPSYRLTPLHEQRGGVVVARMRVPAVPRVRDIARTAESVDSRISISGVAAAQVIVERTTGASRGRTTFLTVDAVLALAVFGVYGLTSYTTESRARELAIRVALGARGTSLDRIAGAQLWWMAALAVHAPAAVSARLVVLLDSIYRLTLMRASLITLQGLPLIASSLTLVVIMAVGVTFPLRRLFRLDVIRTVEGS